MSSAGTVSSSFNRNQPDFDTLEAVFLQALSIDWGAFGPYRHTVTKSEGPEILQPHTPSPTNPSSHALSICFTSTDT
jgi:hypothetical protein